MRRRLTDDERRESARKSLQSYRRTPEGKAARYREWKARLMRGKDPKSRSATDVDVFPEISPERAAKVDV